MLPPELGGPEKRSALLSRSSTEEIRSALLSKSWASRELLFPAALGWSHYLILTRVENEHARTFYEIETVRENWSTPRAGTPDRLSFVRAARQEP